MSDVDASNLKEQPVQQQIHFKLSYEERREIEQAVKALLAEDDPRVQAMLSARLQSYGEKAVEPLIETLRKKETSMPSVMKILYVLEKIGKPAIQPLIEIIETKEVSKPEDTYLLKNILDIFLLIKDKSTVEACVKLLQRLNESLGTTEDASRDLISAIKVKLHLTLAQMKDKRGLEDLLNMFGDGEKRVRPELIQAIKEVGDKRALVPLLKYYRREINISFYNANLAKETFREIVRREKVDNNDQIFECLSPEEKQTLEKLFPKTRNGTTSSQTQSNPTHHEH